MNLKIEWLKYFITLCEFNSFTDSAKKLDITVSSLSQNITALEKFLGVNLIVRKSKFNEITKEGYLFLEKAKESFSQFESLENSFKDYSKQNKKSSLKISWTNIWGSYILPELIDSLFKEFNNVYPQIYAFTIQESIKFIELNEIDFAIVTIKNGDDLFLKDNKELNYFVGKKVFFVTLFDNNNIYLNGSFPDKKDFVIKTASINSLLYLSEKGSFSTYLPEILVDKNKININKREDIYIQPVLIWNKNILPNNLKNKIIDSFIEINK